MGRKILWRKSWSAETLGDDKMHQLTLQERGLITLIWDFLGSQTDEYGKFIVNGKRWDSSKILERLWPYFKHDHTTIIRVSSWYTSANHPRIHRYRLGAHRLLAFERNINYQMSEDLKQAGGNEPLEKSVEIEAKLVAPAHVYDLRAQKHYGKVSAFRFSLDPWRPPAANVEHLMLRRDVVDAVADGRFHVYAIASVDEGITLLTGVPAGDGMGDGSYPAGSFNARGRERLRDLAERRREFAGPPSGDPGDAS